MKFRILFSISLFSLLAVNAYAQNHEHSDIEFGYENGALVIEAGEFTTEGIMIFESAFEALEIDGQPSLGADEPGFDTPVGEGLVVNPQDTAWLNVLDASEYSSVGVGYVNYYDPHSGMLELLGLPNQIGIIDNTETGTDDLVIGSSISDIQDNPQFIGIADDNGEIHDHVVFDLLNEGSMPLGAYGMLFQLQTDFDFDGIMDLTSDEFWIVFNHGMTESDFENLAIPAFGPTSGAVPEPGSAAILFVAALVFGLRRRIVA